jgi:flagellar hook protein FlgE
MISVIRSGMDAALQNLDVTSNNIANTRTTGFKKREANFVDMYSTAIRTPTGGRIGVGVRTPEIRMMQTQGNLKNTDQALDLAIEGNGLFALRNEANPNSDLYTRDGSFGLNTDGVIVNREGYSLLSAVGQEISVPATSAGVLTVNGFQEFNPPAKLTSIAILKDGSIEASYGGVNIVTVGKVGLASFSDPNRLTPVGANLFRASKTSGAAVLATATEEGRGKIHSGALEMANTDITEELSNMIRAQQAFSGSSRLLQAETEMVRKFV